MHHSETQQCSKFTNIPTRGTVTTETMSGEKEATTEDNNNNKP